MILSIRKNIKHDHSPIGCHRIQGQRLSRYQLVELEEAWFLWCFSMRFTWGLPQIQHLILNGGELAHVLEPWSIYRRPLLRLWYNQEEQGTTAEISTSHYRNRAFLAILCKDKLVKHSPGEHWDGEQGCVNNTQSALHRSMSKTDTVLCIFMWKMYKLLRRYHNSNTEKAPLTKTYHNKSLIHYKMQKHKPDGIKLRQSPIHCNAIQSGFRISTNFDISLKFTKFLFLSLCLLLLPTIFFHPIVRRRSLNAVIGHFGKTENRLTCIKPMKLRHISLTFTPIGQRKFARAE